MDDKTWALRYVVVDTPNWLPGGKGAAAPEMDRVGQLGEGGIRKPDSRGS